MRAQGALEYLLLLGGAVVVAAIVVALILFLAGQGGTTPKNAIYLEEIKKMQLLTNIDLTTLRGLYRFQNNAYDTSGNGFDGGLVSGNSGPPIFISGKNEYAIQFTGTTESSSVDIKPGVLNGLTDFTIMFWYKTTNASANPINGQLSGAPQVSVDISSAAIVTHLPNGSNQDVTWTGMPTSGTNGSWHHFAFTRSANTQKVYYGCTSLTPSPSSPVNTNAIGIDEFTVKLVNGGAIDELFILSRALSQNEIQTLSGCDPANP